MKEHLATVTEDGMCLFVHEVIPQNTKKINIPCRKQLVVHKHFFPCASKIFEGKEEPTFGAEICLCICLFTISVSQSTHLRTDNIGRQISVHIFMPNKGYYY